MPLDLAVELAPRHRRGLKIANPVMAAAGTFGWGTGYGPLADVTVLGAIVTNGTTEEARDIAPSPRVAEVPGGLINAIGYPNPGIRRVLADSAPAWANSPVDIIVNLVPTSAAEAHELGRALCNVDGVSGVEIDITLALQHSTHRDYVSRVVHTLMDACDVPVIVKLPATGIDVLETAARMEQIGVDALSVINTLPAMAIDVRRQQAVLASKFGGLSGPATKSIALYFVWQVTQRVSIPVIGVGGISAPNDAIEFLLAGATAVQVGSASFRNPNATIDIVEGVKRYLEQVNAESPADIRGRVR